MAFAIDVKMHKVSGVNDKFIVYQLTGDRIAIVNPSMKSGLSELDEISRAPIFSKEHVETLKTVLLSIISSYNQPGRKDSQLIDFVLLDSEVKTNVQSSAFAISNTAMSNTTISSGREILYRLQYIYSKGQLSNTESIKVYSKGPYGYSASESTSIEDLKRLIENLSK